MQQNTNTEADSSGQRARSTSTGKKQDRKLHGSTEAPKPWHVLTHELMGGLFKNTFKGQRLITSSEPEKWIKNSECVRLSWSKDENYKHAQRKRNLAKIQWL